MYIVPPAATGVILAASVVPDWVFPICGGFALINVLFAIGRSLPIPAFIKRTQTKKQNRLLEEKLTNNKR